MSETERHSAGEFSGAASSGRIRLDVTARLMGSDFLVVLTGGQAHAGGCALAETNTPAKSVTAAGHRDAELAEYMANFLRQKLSGTIIVVAGVHYDAITRDEINLVFSLCRNLAESIGERFAPRKPRLEEFMLTIKELNAFEEYLKSGELEKNFKLAGEMERGEILELLEKLMDVADVADEVATRLIFRGQISQNGDE